MRRNIFGGEHDAFRCLVRDFIQAKVVPHFSEREAAGQVPHELYGRLGETGVMGISLPEEVARAVAARRTECRSRACRRSSPAVFPDSGWPPRAG